MQDEIRVQVQVVDDQIAIINLTGQVTTFAEEAIKRAYQQVSGHNIHNIIFNFKETDYIDSLGICIFIDVVTDARQKQQHLFLNLPNTHTQKLFRMVGLNHYTAIYNSLDDTLAALETLPEAEANFARLGQRELAA